MDATANFSLRFARASDSKAKTTDWLLSRQALQRISTGMSLVSLALGFWVFAMLIIINRHQAELNSLSGGSSFAMVGGIGAFLAPLVSIGGFAPDIQPLCRLGARPPVSFSPNPTQSQ